ncbi:MAG: hypothetical protein FWD61_05185 [Phycisphaerales bacterium]|nr:hypothetical protein [Phycisphaerales bacterium]
MTMTMTMPMTVDASRQTRRFTRAEYYHLAELVFLGSDHRLRRVETEQFFPS